jgi:hypothetical protein
MENVAVTVEDIVQPHQRLDRTARLRLSLVIPAFNEAARLGDGVARLARAVAAGAVRPDTMEFIIVDDGSVDDTATVARGLFAPYPHVQVIRLAGNSGKGAAVRAGVAAATAPAIAFADADMAIDPAQTPQFTSALAQTDLAIGSRAATGSSVDRPSIRRSVMNRSFNHFVNAVTRLSLSDTQCGFKAFRAPAAKLLFHLSRTDRMAFDVEVLALARRLGLPISEVPVHWLRVRGSRVRPWIEPTSMARDVLRSHRAGAAAPPVPALEMPAGHGGPQLAAMVHELSATLPVLQRGGTTTLVLCPLMEEGGIERLRSRIAAVTTGVAVGRSSLTATQLCNLAPLSLPWGADFMAPETR